MATSNFFLVTPDNAESGAVETLPITENLQVIKNSEVLDSDLRFLTNDLVCITSEASIELVKKRLDDSQKKNAISLLKDKFRFREILRKIYPNYSFKNLAFSEIESLVISKKSVLKPTKGCFGTAVKILTEKSDLSQIATEIRQELKKNSSVLSKEVLSENEFILEDFIEGEEYAIDMFYDQKGNPNIVNIYHHPMPKIDAYLHMLYYTSREVFDKIYVKAMKFFEELNDILGVKNFAMHGEFRFNQNILFPIEINSMRFGGMGLGNMIYYAVGINPYKCFKDGIAPDWNSIWNTEANYNSIYAFFIAYNGTDINKNLYKPNIYKLKSEFTEVIHQELFDYESQLALGVFCLKETPTNLEKLLSIEFNHYFELI